MILSRCQSRLLVVRQPDHGTQTGLIAAAWGNDELPYVDAHAAQARLAAAHHDDGWAVWERRPGLDPDTGQPTQFFAVGPREHIPAYRAGIARAAQIDPWAGMLVSMHGAGLYNDRYGTYRLEELGEQALSEAERELVDEFLADMAELQHRLFAESRGHAALVAPHRRPEVLRAYLLLQVWDRLSLQLAFRHAAEGAIAPMPGPNGTSLMLQCRNAGRFALTLDPYPFADDVVSLPVLASQLPDREYSNPEDFLAELAAAPAQPIECTVSRPARAW